MLAWAAGGSARDLGGIFFVLQTRAHGVDVPKKLLLLLELPFSNKNHPRSYLSSSLRLTGGIVPGFVLGQQTWMEGLVHGRSRVQAPLGAQIPVSSPAQLRFCPRWGDPGSKLLSCISHTFLHSSSKTPGCCTCTRTPGRGSRSRWRTKTTEPRSCGAILPAG